VDASTEIDRFHKQPWSHSVVVADPDLVELATNQPWRDAMIARRKAKGMTQKQLSFLVGCKQPDISGIEAGPDKKGVGSSKFILKICKVLGLPPPLLFDSEVQRRWSELGHALEHENIEQFRANQPTDRDEISAARKSRAAKSPRRNAAHAPQSHARKTKSS
jgi:transcriptional regulator with XRE-family HTH domain